VEKYSQGLDGQGKGSFQFSPRYDIGGGLAKVPDWVDTIYKINSGRPM